MKQEITPSAVNERIIAEHLADVIKQSFQDKYGCYFEFERYSESAQDIIDTAEEVYK